MRPASGLTLVAIGAILAFAVTGHLSFLNVQVAGWVIMLTGVAGMVIPRRGYGWLRRRILLRRGPSGRRPVVKHVEEPRYPPYVMLNPGATVADEPSGTAPSGTAAAAGDPPRHPDLARDNAGGAGSDDGQRGSEQPVADWAVAERP
jgi:hypothetical protein